MNHKWDVKFLALGFFLPRTSCRFGYPEGEYVMMYTCTYAAHSLLHYMTYVAFMLCKSLFCRELYMHILYVQWITQTILPLLNCSGEKMINVNEKLNTTEFKGNSVILFIGTKISALLFTMDRDNKE